MTIVDDKRKYVLVKTKSLIRRLRQQDCGALQGVYRHVDDLVEWNTFRDWAYRGCFRMPLNVFARLKKTYEIKDVPRGHRDSMVRRDTQESSKNNARTPPP